MYGENLSTGEISTYEVVGGELASKKKTIDLNELVKTYDWKYKQTDGDYISENLTLRGKGFVSGETENYYSLVSVDGLSDLVSEYNLPFPINDKDLQKLIDNWDSWTFNVDGYYHIVASVKINSSGSPYLLKLYRGGDYIPTERELSLASEYWDNVSS
jgi:hypothetical protein